MRARPLNTRVDFLRLLPDSCPSRSCERALKEGFVTVLGGFTPPGALPLILARVESFRGNIWYIGLRVDEASYRYLPVWFKYDEVPWAHWDGSATGDRLFIDGEEPRRCAALRDMRRYHGDEDSVFTR